MAEVAQALAVTCRKIQGGKMTQEESEIVKEYDNGLG